MKFSRQRQIDMIPEVPSDQTDRRRAIQRATTKLKQAEKSVPRALKVVEAMQAHDNHNHYAQRLRIAYGVEGHPND